jgi:hypothetical protein
MAGEFDCFFRKEMENKDFALQHGWAMVGMWWVDEPSARFVGQQPTAAFVAGTRVVR